MEDDLEKREDDKITKNDVKESEAFSRYFSKKKDFKFFPLFFWFRFWPRWNTSKKEESKKTDLNDEKLKEIKINDTGVFTNQTEDQTEQELLESTNKMNTEAVFIQKKVESNIAKS